MSLVNFTLTISINGYILEIFNASENVTTNIYNIKLFILDFFNDDIGQEIDSNDIIIGIVRNGKGIVYPEDDNFEINDGDELYVNFHYHNFRFSGDKYDINNLMEPKDENFLEDLFYRDIKRYYPNYKSEENEKFHKIKMKKREKFEMEEEKLEREFKEEQEKLEREFKEEQEKRRSDFTNMLRGLTREFDDSLDELYIQKLEDDLKNMKEGGYIASATRRVLNEFQNNLQRYLKALENSKKILEEREENIKETRRLNRERKLQEAEEKGYNDEEISELKINLEKWDKRIDNLREEKERLREKTLSRNSRREFTDILKQY